MPNTDHDGLGPGFERRLKDALDSIAPPSSPPRYLSSSARAGAWRIAPVALAVGATCLLALTAIAATGSPSPVVWTQRAASTLEGIGHHSDPSPHPESEATPSGGPVIAGPGRETPEPEHGGAAPTPSHGAEQEPSPEPRESPVPAQSPEPSESPEPSGSPSPSGDRSESSPSPTPSPTSGYGDH